MKISQSRKSSCMGENHRKVEFSVGDLLFLKVPLMKCIQRFGLKGKLQPRFVGTFEIVQRVGEVAYKLPFTQSITMHKVLCLIMLRGFCGIY